tara:strand:+ start:6857 stop:8047 length:1191 start_codon:yes stop_codon:yes gene_type:complete
VTNWKSLKQFHKATTILTAASIVFAAPALAQSTDTDTGAATTAMDGQVKVEQGQPKVSVTIAEPNVDVDQSQPQVTVEQPQPEITVRVPKPTVNVEQQAPIVTIEQAQPVVTVRIPEPIITVIVPRPDVDVDQADPDIAVQMPEPKVEFIRPEPRIQIEESEPQVNVRQAEPTVSIDEREAAQVDVEQAEPNVEIEQAEGEANVNVDTEDPQVNVEEAEEANIDVQQGEADVNVQTGENDDDQAAMDTDRADDTESSDTSPDTAVILFDVDESGRMANDEDREGYREQMRTAPWANMQVDEFLGRDVLSETGEDIGEIDGVGKRGDQVVAIVSVGGFLGLGEHSVAIPLERMELVRDDILLPTHSEAELESMPEYSDRDVQLVEGNRSIMSILEMD